MNRPTGSKREPRIAPVAMIRRPDTPHAFRERKITTKAISRGLFWNAPLTGTCDVCGGSELSKVHL